MTDQAQEPQFQPVTDVQLDPNTVIEQLGQEVGTLSKDLVIANLKLQAAINEINRINFENAGLKSRVLSQQADIAAMREQLADPNHPAVRRRRQAEAKGQATTST